MEWPIRMGALPLVMTTRMRWFHMGMQGTLRQKKGTRSSYPPQENGNRHIFPCISVGRTSKYYERIRKMAPEGPTNLQGTAIKELRERIPDAVN